jgi:hypothetical protein
MKLLTAYLGRNWQRLALAFVVLTLATAGLLDPHSALIAGAGAMMLNFETVAGSTLSVSVAAPATYDTAGYTALTYTPVGEITDLGSGLGRDYNTTPIRPSRPASRSRRRRATSWASWPSSWRGT